MWGAKISYSLSFVIRFGMFLTITVVRKSLRFAIMPRSMTKETLDPRPLPRRPARLSSATGSGVPSSCTDSSLAGTIDGLGAATETASDSQSRPDPTDPRGDPVVLADADPAPSSVVPFKDNSCIDNGAGRKTPSGAEGAEKYATITTPEDARNEESHDLTWPYREAVVKASTSEVPAGTSNKKVWETPTAASWHACTSTCMAQQQRNGHNT
mmetsp:Transcript_27290/g.65780  ORF Transcript_27290/g.65780 Transcript_27290/m.65780 type:complete len:212 (+) Transcript_27290:1059-1694(+)